MLGYRAVGAWGCMEALRLQAVNSWACVSVEQEEPVVMVGPVALRHQETQGYNHNRFFDQMSVQLT